MEDPGHRKPVLNGLNKPGERAQRQKLNFHRGWDSNPQPLDRQFSFLPLSYHRRKINIIQTEQLRVPADGQFSHVTLPGDQRYRPTLGGTLKRQVLPLDHFDGIVASAWSPGKLWCNNLVVRWKHKQTFADNSFTMLQNLRTCTVNSICSDRGKNSWNTRRKGINDENV